MTLRFLLDQISKFELCVFNEFMYAISRINRPISEFHCLFRQFQYSIFLLIPQIVVKRFLNMLTWDLSCWIIFVICIYGCIRLFSRHMYTSLSTSSQLATWTSIPWRLFVTIWGHHIRLFTWCIMRINWTSNATATDCF